MAINVSAQSLKGAWKSQQPNNSTAVMILADDYLMISSFSILNKYFDRTEGGTFTMKDGKLTYNREFHSADTAKINKTVTYQVDRKDSILTLRSEDEDLVWMLVDDAASVPMAGTWHITERANGDAGELVKIHQSGTRKTLKILSGTRFQWAAIDPAVKGFYGTGGGSYTIKDGKYTEKIEFFSRDNHRVGAELSFNWALKDGRWDHSGKSSKGDPIHEVWEKIK
ncbi:hypothetical protein EZE20_02295 [Arundinibacter roseus]|uniref:Membrane or secreted protein n=2 Tax=Arundinibacter roseus TaxID=2070510 RepID=A0A4R4KLT8_9BACT|nr:hypothetical protein EZE20_02295 [Arundinibacter roseus]